MLDAERSVVVAGDEHLQDLLRDHPARVTIELVPVGPRLEARLDGLRVGELTALMSLRYAPTVDGVLRRGERPGCVGRVVRGKHGVEVELRLPAVNAAGGPPTEQLPVVVAARPRKRSRTPLWVGVAIVGLLVVIGGALGLARGVTPPAAAVAVPTPVARRRPPWWSGPRSGRRGRRRPPRRRSRPSSTTRTAGWPWPRARRPSCVASPATDPAWTPTATGWPAPCEAGEPQAALSRRGARP